MGMLLLACQAEKHKNRSREKISVPLSVSILGDWTVSSSDSLWELIPMQFTFEDSLCTYIRPWGNFTPYSISGDTIWIRQRHIYNEKDSILGTETYRFKVLFVDSTELRLQMLDSITKALFEYYLMPIPDIITLFKNQPQNQFKPSRISFYSSGCLGTCPSQLIEIDSNRNLHYFGLYNTALKNGHIGKLSIDQYEQVLRQVQNIELNSLSEYYAIHASDRQSCCIRLEFDNTIIESCAYGYGKDPKPLRFLFHKLFEIHELTIMKKDTTLQLQDFSFHHIVSKVSPRVSPYPDPAVP